MTDGVVNNEKNGKKSFFRPIIGVIYLIGTFFIFALVMLGYVNQAWRTETSMIVGALIAKSGTIIDWAFGDSEGSRKKTELMAVK